MNFFQAIFADDADPSESESEHDAPVHDPLESVTQELENPSESSGAWSFGGLMKTLTSKSESVMETYRRDLIEFGTGIKKEIEVAQGSLGTVGLAIDEIGSTVMKGTAQIISQGKDVLLTVASDDRESDSSSSSSVVDKSQLRLSSNSYSRFDAQIATIQGDPNTFTDEPEDAADFEKWKSEFDIEGKRNEMETLLKRNEEMENLYKKMVPDLLDEEKFWYRYYFKVHKLEVAENIRAKIVNRAISMDEEELSWDIDDEEVSENVNKGNEKILGSENVEVTDEVNMGAEVKELPQEDGDDTNANEVGDDKQATNSSEVVDGNVVASENVNESCSVEVHHSAKEEEELGWDEIEDMSSIEEKKAKDSGGAPNMADLKKRLSAAEEEDDDLGWDIEADDNEDKAFAKKQ